MNEWELLIDSEDIKTGDYVDVELENGRIMVLKVVKWNSKYVVLKTPSKELVRFYSDSLESKHGCATIVGKHEED